MVEMLETKFERLSSANPPINNQWPSSRRVGQKRGNDLGRAGRWRSASFGWRRSKGKAFESEFDALVKLIQLTNSRQNRFL
jgi:hypothetical protein